jgi:WD40 repeat protein
MVAGPFTGHTELIWSVGFSPEGKRIISGSCDGTIRVWNATTGETVAGPFKGQLLDPIISVAFSPDGQQIVSGSNNGTICLWNASTGDTVAGPFRGHTLQVNSVAFSPDGRHIVSGSGDGTIRVWNTAMGDTVAGPFGGYSDSVTSVETSELASESSDGRRMIISSRDESIHVLDATTENLITTTQVYFTDQSVINKDGWICGKKHKLLMWIPPVHRANLHRPSNIWVAGEYETRLDLSNFVHGHSWTSCIDS